jgi:calcineurin-like phosphoesterase
MSIAQNRHGTIVFLGDIVGQPGRRAALQAIPQILERLAPAAIIANAENIRNGSGCTPDLYRGLRDPW